MRLLLGVVAAGLVAGWPQDRPEVFHSATHAVAVDVAVFDGRTPVRSLGPADFEVLDNGVTQTVASVESQQLPIDLRLVFDMSGSITPAELEQYRRAMRDVADTLRPDDHCEIVTFTTRVTVAAARQSPPVAIDLHRSLPDNTSFYDAVSLALVTVPSPRWRQVVIVLSDAQDNTSFFDEATLMETATRSDAVVYAVLPVNGGAPPPAALARLRSLALLTGGRVVPSQQAAQIGSTIIGALQEFRQSYVVRYTLSGARPGWHPLSVKVRGPRGYVVRARTGYFLG